MAYVITFEDFQPVPRYDGLPWTEARIEEASTSDGSYTEIDTITLDPVDADPSVPAVRDFTTENATAANLWYRIIFVDGTGDETSPTTPIQNLTTLHRYVTEAQVKNAASMVGETFADDELDVILPAVCGAIDAYKRTTFYPQTATRYYTAALGTLELPIYDLNSLTSLEVDADGDGSWETEWDVNVDFYLHPANAAAAGRPYNRIILNGRAAVFPPYQNSVKIVGSWGWAQTPSQVELAAVKLCVRELHQLRSAPMGIVVASDVAARLGSVYRDIAYLLDTLNPRQQAVSLQVG